VLLSEVAVEGQLVYLASKGPFTPSTTQYSLLEDIKRAEGDLYCVYVLVGKCSHMVQGGETLDRLAKLYKTDWLSIFHANPNLFNPATLKTGQVLRLGVSYKLNQHDSVDGVGVLADRFLVSQDVLEFWNPELTTDILVDTVFGSAGSDINVEVRLRRNMLQAEAISIPLPWLNGESWVGAVPESCSSVKRVWTLGGCQVPDEACGAGNAGTCSYDSMGHIGCSLPTCEGEHEQLRHARWNQGSHTLDLTLSKDMSAGRRIRAVIPRTRALTYPRSTVPPRTAIGHVPLLHTLPLNDVQPSALLPDFGSTYGIQNQQLDLCVLLPLCDEGLACTYGSDCSKQT
jgi:hypothetical protein